MKTDPKNTICLYGHTENENYGSWLTYFALYSSLVSLFPDKKILMIPRSSSVTPDKVKNGFNCCNPDSWSAKFFNQYCEMAERLPFERFNEYNKIADTFIIGSDMIWKYIQYLWSQDTFYLNFVDDSKKKLAFATSFGTDGITKIFKENLDKIEVVKNYLKRFNSISCREDSGCDIIEKEFGMPRPQHMIDPVFLCVPGFYEYWVKKSNLELPIDYSVYYEVSGMCTKKKIWNDLVKNLTEELNVKTLYWLPDGHPGYAELMNQYDNRFKLNIGGLDWLKYMINAKYVFTDSFHGVCLRLIMNKPFVYLEKSYDQTRVRSLGRMLGVDIESCKLFDGPWDKVNEGIKHYKELGENWLINNVN